MTNILDLHQLTSTSHFVLTFDAMATVPMSLQLGNWIDDVPNPTQEGVLRRDRGPGKILGSRPSWHITPTLG